MRDEAGGDQGKVRRRLGRSSQGEAAAGGLGREEMAHAAKALAAKKKLQQMEFDAENEDMVKRLKLEIDLEMSTQQGHRLDDHQSPLSTEQYSASSRRPMHVHATCTRLHLTPHPVSHELLTRTCSHTRNTYHPPDYTRRTVHLRIETARDEYMAKVPSLRWSAAVWKGVRLLCTSTAASCIREAFKSGATASRRSTRGLMTLDFYSMYTHAPNMYMHMRMHMHM